MRYFTILYITIHSSLFNIIGKKLVSGLGGKSIDILINNAGYFYEPVEKVNNYNIKYETLLKLNSIFKKYLHLLRNILDRQLKFRRRDQDD